MITTTITCDRCGSKLSPHTCNNLNIKAHIGSLHLRKPISLDSNNVATHSLEFIDVQLCNKCYNYVMLAAYRTIKDPARIVNVSINPDIEGGLGE